MVLLKKQSEREGFEEYTDLFLAWQHDKKNYVVRIRPVFGCHMKTLMANAIEVLPGDTFAKYM